MPYIDLTGEVFERLTVKYIVDRKDTGLIWRCICECGNFKDVLSVNLKRGHTLSCGCLHKELLSKRTKKHGHSKNNKSVTKTYNSWHGMLQRCTNKNTKSYKNYGGRGITVCPKWLDFSKFLKDMGTRPLGTSIDRIDNDLGYSPNNCRWATPKEQAGNQRKRKCLHI